MEFGSNPPPSHFISGDVIMKIKVVVVDEEGARVKTINNNLVSMQEIVGGFIECIPWKDRFNIVCNEEGKILGLSPTLMIGYDVIVGTCFFTKTDRNNEFVSLSDDDISLIQDELGVEIQYA